MNQDKTKQMLNAVGQRQRWIKIGQRFQVMLIVFTALYLVLLFAARLFDVVPEELISWPLHEHVVGVFMIALHWPVTMILIPIFAFLFALLPMPKVSEVEAAVAADHQIESKDLFLTSLQLGSAPGTYKPLVEQEAEERANDVKPEKAVPFLWGKPAMFGAIMLLLLFCLGVFVPKMDPWGFEAEKQQVAKQSEQLKELRKETTIRSELLKERKEKQASQNIERLVNDLKKTLQMMAPKRQAETEQQLKQVRRELDKVFNERKAEALQNTSKKKAAQRAVQQDKNMQQAQQELAKGNASKAKEAIEKVQQAAKKLENAKTDEERKAAADEMAKELEKLKQMAQNSPGGKNLERALENAIKQAKMGGQNKGLQKQAAEDLQKSLELAKQEAQNMAQNQKEIQKIQQAMKTAQMAQKANQDPNQQMQGMQGAKTLEEYQKNLEKMAGGGNCPNGCPEGTCPGGGQAQGPGGQPGPGEQPGMPGGEGGGNRPGGKGGVMPETQGLEMAGQTEKVESSIKAGKILASWEVEGKAKRGNITVERAELQKSIKDAVGESIVKEQTPPDYQGAIKRYFDSQDSRP